MKEKITELFPNEIILYIFSFLSIKELIRLRQVSRNCKKASESIMSNLFDQSKHIKDPLRVVKFYCFLQLVDQDIYCKVFKNFAFFVLLQMPNVFEAFIKKGGVRIILGDHLFASSSNTLLIEDLQLEESLLDDEIKNSLFFKQKIINIEKYKSGNITFNLLLNKNKIYYFYLDFLFLQAVYYSLSLEKQASMIECYLKKHNFVCHVEFENNMARIGFVKYEDLQLTFRIPVYNRKGVIKDIIREAFQVSASYRKISMLYHRNRPDQFCVDRLSFEAYGLEKIVSYKPNKELLIKKIDAEVFNGKKSEFFNNHKKKIGLGILLVTISIGLFFIPIIGPFLMGALAFLITKIGLGLSIGACITAGTIVFGTGVGVGKFVNIDDTIKIPSTCLPCFGFFKHKENQNFGSNFSTTVDNQPK